MNLGTDFLDIWRQQNFNTPEMPTSGLVFYAPLKNANVEVGSFKSTPTNTFETYQGVPSVLTNANGVGGGCKTTASFNGCDVPKTMSIWINPTSGGGTIMGVPDTYSEINSPWISHNFRLFLSGTTVMLTHTSASYEAGGGTESISGGSVPLNKWTHVVARYTCGGISEYYWETRYGYYSIWVNGVQKRSVTCPYTWPCDGGLTLGAAFKGHRAAARLYKRALSSDEIKLLATEFKHT